MTANSVPISEGRLLSARRCRGIAAALLAMHAGLVMWMDYRNTPGIDELGHLPAGISIWHFGRFDLYRVNPPLVKLVASLPVVLAQPKTDWSRFDDRPSARPEWAIGKEFTSINGDQAFWYFTLARWACIPFSLLGGVICFRWASELYGPVAGLLSLSLWCFGPTVLGNAAMITPDVAAASLGVASTYAFWHWLQKPDWSRTLLAGGMLGLAELTKTTWLVLYGVWPVLWLVWNLGTRPPPRCVPNGWAAAAIWSRSCC